MTQAAKKKKKTAARKARKKPLRTPQTPDSFSVEPGWINKKTAAKSMGISVQAFDQYGIQPVAKRHKYGEAFYTLRQIVDNRVRRAVEEERAQLERDLARRLPSDAEDLIVEQAKADLAFKREQGETQRLKNEQLRRELAPVQALTLTLANLAAQIAAILEPLPGKIKRRLPKLNKTDLQVIQREIVKAQNTCAELKLDFDELDASEQNGD